MKILSYFLWILFSIGMAYYLSGIVWVNLDHPISRSFEMLGYFFMMVIAGARIRDFIYVIRNDHGI